MASRKLKIARRWMAMKMPINRMNREIILSGDAKVNEEFEAIAGPVPVLD